ncbi:hypothetical protein [Lentzea jiangxiensis]|uniref:Uncharacterized protein n=1 Tax=Lentzea jiangxiensis TaxID=641025 RepID=A0A1H0S261_9PSEU|nr:hypothetical protein [Lentzea jiangxiensis]SDP35832.1 hypothetical protein SAMN05421507_107196 [Lentzea jiangxiensis]
MGQLGELFPGRKLRSEATEAGTGEDHEETGPLDLTSGAVRLRPRPKPVPAPESDE